MSSYIIKNLSSYFSPTWNLYVFFQGPLIIKDNETDRYTLIGVASVAQGSLVNRTVVATYARINQVLPWIYSFIYDIEYEEEIITSKSVLNDE